MYETESMRINKLIGNNVKTFRIFRLMSLSKLANKLDITGAQLYKYEKGINRISASKLMIVSRLLQIPVEQFYSDLSENKDLFIDNKVITDNDFYIQVIRAFANIEDTHQQKILYQLIVAFIKEIKKQKG